MPKPHTLLEDIPARTGALREAESIWFKERFTLEEAQRIWREKSVEGYDLRDQLLHSFRFAFRGADDLLGRVTAISQGNGHADMIQDLNDISVLGKQNSERLQKINLDMSLLDTAAGMAASLSEQLARATKDRSASAGTRVIRDQAYTWLKEAVDEVRVTGQYVFRGDADRLKGYRSEYHRRGRKAPAAVAANTAPTTEEEPTT